MAEMGQYLPRAPIETEPRNAPAVHPRYMAKSTNYLPQPVAPPRRGSERYSPLSDNYLPLRKDRAELAD